MADPHGNSAACSPEPPSPWLKLLPELFQYIARELRPNEAACSLRLVNKAAAEALRGPQHTTVRLSQPVPPHAFASKWGARGSTHGLSLKQRTQLLCLTASTGVQPNLELALAVAGCLLRAEVLQAAAAAGQLATCELLLGLGCPRDGALAAAARAGRRDVVEWLLARGVGAAAGGGSDGRAVAGAGHEELFEAALAAARGGHVGLMEWLLEAVPLQRGTKTRWSVLEAAAEGCDLATLQRLEAWSEAMGGLGVAWAGGLGRFDRSCRVGNDAHGARILAAAAASPTRDWQAKVTWLRSVGYPKLTAACDAAAARTDAPERLAALQELGFHVLPRTAVAAARAGNLAGLRYLRERSVRLDGAVVAGAEAGSQDVLVWLVEDAFAVGQQGEAVLQSGGLAEAAARSGSLDLLRWLAERGLVPAAELLSGRTFAGAADAGDAAALEWLAERGCAMPADGSPYRAPCAKGDLATLRCLQRLGCPWGRAGSVFGAAVWDKGGPAVLRWLLEAGCPVEAAEVESLLRRAGVAGAEELLALLAQQRAEAGERGSEATE
ncbi:hypothetical protein GPECTOR_4g827 [Gonium pectorale]|uniref:Uncharacterized protein n=1 Tax=Gonium pectorale TaxID=33097 RepID=A0A150GXY6_GONPE|nr:hypothetical protein GPECTOR_4g827 [Gonium pectorale]|eukprot:KXZ54757.1 hypothetical protein GPECTOR_4g827 [Gonium pectorale]